MRCPRQPLRARYNFGSQRRGKSAGDADLIVLRGGSAGFAAAIRAHELGAKGILVEAGVLGGTCVNVGRVPSKALLRAAEAHDRAQRSRFADIESSSRVVSFPAVVHQKAELVGYLRQAKYVDVLAAYPNLRLLTGRAGVASPKTLDVNGQNLRAHPPSPLGGCPAPASPLAPRPGELIPAQISSLGSLAP